MKTRRTCDVHGTELEETRPWDPENDPEIRLTCRECEGEELLAYAASVCLLHRSPLGACLPRFDDGEPVEMEVTR